MHTLENDTGIAKRLLDEGFLSKEQLNTAAIAAKKQNLNLLDYVITAELIDADAFALTTAKNFGYPLLHLPALLPEKLPLAALNTTVITQYKVLPLHTTNTTITIAIADPTHRIVLDKIQFSTGKQVIPVIVNCKHLAKLITVLLHQFNNNEISETNDVPIIHFVDKILSEAITKNASDIHFEPYDKFFRIRFRLDGILQEIHTSPLIDANRICARLKVMANLDIAERRIPQDGRFELNIPPANTVDFRISTCPTIGGEKIVARILDPAAAHNGIDALGFEPQQKQLFLHHINQPQGMILVTGPTGSGKTATMYTAITILNTAANNISTVEDPVEIHLPGINQVNINLKAGLTFATALRAFLRQDPDIIMVGEMRDLETAEIAIKAAQTGHLVLSTLHTNTAAETLTRLANMGVPSYNIATSTSLIIAQRLVRKLCPHCKLIDNLAAEILISAYKNNPIGCEFCQQGFKGRTGIFEMLPITAEISNAILSGANSLQLLALAKTEAMLTLKEASLLKVQAGITSLSEINIGL